MKYLLVGFIFTACCELLCAVEAKSFEACFRGAIARSEILSDQNEQILQAEAKYKQAIGAILPSVTATASYQQQQDISSGQFPASQPLVKATLTQPLFQGFKEFAGMRQAKDLISAQQYSKWQALVQLFDDMASNFYTLLSFERDLRDVQEELKLYDQRIVDLRRYVRIGRSRLSEVLTAETQMQTLGAQADQIKQQIKTYREVLHFLTGFDKEVPIVDDETLPRDFKPLTAYLSEVEKRPDVLSARDKMKASEEGIRVASGSRFPTINLQGDAFALRSGSQQGVTWDVLATLSLPIFQGGIIDANVRLAESAKAQNDLALSRTQRLAEQEVGTFYENLVNDRNQVAAFESILNLAEKNYKTELQDYQHGLVNNLDVLTALTAFQESQRSLDRSKFALKLDYAKLEASVGHRPQANGSVTQ